MTDIANRLRVHRRSGLTYQVAQLAERAAHQLHARIERARLPCPAHV